MRRDGIRARVGPPLALLAAATVIAIVTPPAIAALPGDLGPEAADRTCADLSKREFAGAARQRGPGQAGERSVRLVTDSDGQLIGRTLELATPAGRKVRHLPPESFVAEPAGALQVFGFDRPAAGSRVWAMDWSTGCEHMLAADTNVVRSAIADATGSALYVHSVSRALRADLGVTRHDLTDQGAREVVPPLRTDDRFGPTFSTELRWSASGDELAVVSCGFAACRTRILDVATEDVATIDRPAHGALVGFTRETLVAFDTCPGRPCALLAIDRASGAVQVLADEAFDAQAADREGALLITVQTTAGEIEVLL